MRGLLGACMPHLWVIEDGRVPSRPQVGRTGALLLLVLLHLGVARRTAATLQPRGHDSAGRQDTEGAAHRRTHIETGPMLVSRMREEACEGWRQGRGGRAGS